MSFRYTMIGAAVCIFVFYLGLILSLFYFVGGKGFWEALSHPNTLFSIRLSLIAATVATFFAVIIGLPSAYALSRFEFVGKRILDTFLEIPMIISPMALGAAFLVFFNTPLGELIQTKGIFFVFEVPGIILAQFATIAGLTTRLMKASLDEISPRYEAVARSLGSSPWQAFYRVTLPLSFQGTPRLRHPFLGKGVRRIWSHGHSCRGNAREDGNDAHCHFYCFSLCKY